MPGGGRIAWYDRRSVALRATMIEPKTAKDFIRDQTRRWEAERGRGKLIRMKDIGRGGWSFWLREAWTFQIQHDYRVKVLVLERLAFDHHEGARAHPWDGQSGVIQYRLGYYTIGAFGAGIGSWRWGQYSPMIPKQDLDELLANARSDGTLL
jgi:hypothetical protein